MRRFVQVERRGFLGIDSVVLLHTILIHIFFHPSSILTFCLAFLPLSTVFLPSSAPSYYLAKIVAFSMSVNMSERENRTQFLRPRNARSEFSVKYDSACQAYALTSTFATQDVNAVTPFTCPICIEDFEVSAQMSCVGNCKHEFHHDCLKKVISALTIFPLHSLTLNITIVDRFKEDLSNVSRTREIYGLWILEWRVAGIYRNRHAVGECEVWIIGVYEWSIRKLVGR